MTKPHAGFQGAGAAGMGDEAEIGAPGLQRDADAFAGERILVDEGDYGDPSGSGAAVSLRRAAAPGALYRLAGQQRPVWRLKNSQPVGRDFFRFGPLFLPGDNLILPPLF